MTFLGFRRSASQPVAINVDGANLIPIGAPIAVADQTASNQANSKNYSTNFNGTSYLLVRTNSGAYVVYVFNGTDYVATPISYTPAANEAVRGTGVIVANNGIDSYLVVVLEVFNGISSERDSVVLRSADGSTFTVSRTGAVGAISLQQPSGILGLYRNFVFFSVSEAGMFFYDPFNDVFPSTLALIGNGGLNNAGYGAFVRFSSLFILFTYDTNTNEIKLYSANPQISIPLTIPINEQWIDIQPQGLPGPGALLLDPTYFQENGSFHTAYVDGDDNLYLMISTLQGLKIYRSSVESFPTFIDVSSQFLPDSIESITNANTN